MLQLNSGAMVTGVTTASGCQLPEAFLLPHIPLVHPPGPLMEENSKVEVLPPPHPARWMVEAPPFHPGRAGPDQPISGDVRKRKGMMIE